jgi:hypothetical protein
MREASTAAGKASAMIEIATTVVAAVIATADSDLSAENWTGVDRAVIGVVIVGVYVGWAAVDGSANSNPEVEADSTAASVIVASTVIATGVEASAAV